MGFLAKIVVNLGCFKINFCAFFTLKTCFVRMWLVVLTRVSKYRYFKMFFYVKTCIPNHRGSYFVRGSIELYINKYRMCSSFVKYLKLILTGLQTEMWVNFNTFYTMSCAHVS